MDRSKQLGEQKISKLLLTFSIPAIVGMLVNALYNVVDRAFIGNSPDIGELGIAGITIGFPIMIIMMALSLLVGIGGGALAAIRLGEQNKDQADHIMANAMVLHTIIITILAVVGLIFLQPILELFGASEAVLPYAKDYMRIILFGSLFGGTSMCLNNFIRVDGSPNIAMLTMLIGAGVNTLLDPIFIYVFHMGIKGAAYATIISQAISFIWVIRYFLSGKSHLRFARKNFKLQPIIIRSILAIGLPSCLMQLANSVMNIILNKSLNLYGGDIAISGMGIINSIQLLMIMPVLGISQGAQPIIGYNFGAKQYKRVLETLKLAIIAATTIVTVGFISTRLFPVQFISAFNKNPELLNFGTYALKTFFLFLPTVGFQIISSTYFQAVGKTKPATFLTLTRQIIILIPAILILPRFFGLEGILYAGPISDLISAILTGIWLSIELKILHKKSIGETLILET